MKKEKDLSVAVLIDGDNASSEKMEDVMRFVSRYGAAVVRRIYGDWTKKSLSGWKDAARDYTLLAQRIRESGLTVLGYGEGKTPVALVRSCTGFLLADWKEEKPFQENTPEFFIQRDMEYFDKAFEQAADGKEEVSLSLIGGVLKKLMPKFKVKRYGCRTLGKLYERLEKYELVKTGKGVAGLVRIKS